jgi:type II secretory pathway component PulF
MTFLQKLLISSKEREDWYRALSKTTGEGFPIMDVLERMNHEFKKTRHPLSPLCDTLIFRLRGGGPNSKHNRDGRRTLGTELHGLVPEDEAMLVQAGVLSGRVESGLLNAANFVSTQRELSASVLSSMMKPFGYLAALVILLIFFSVNLLPKFEAGRPRAAWPPEAQVLGLVADNIGWIAGGMVGFAIASVAFIVFVAPRWFGESRDWFDLRIFPFTIMSSLSGANFLTSMSGYISAGTPINDAVKNIASSATPYLRYQCDKFMNATQNGKRPEEALVQLSIIQPKFHWIISVYGLSGDSSAAYQSISVEMVKETQKFIRQLFDVLIGNVLLFFVGAMLFWIYISMFGIADSAAKRVSMGYEAHIAAIETDPDSFQTRWKEGVLCLEIQSNHA